MSLAHLAWSVDRIDAQPDDLGVALVELGLQPGHVAELGRADRREVLRMREQDRPAVADPLVELDRALGGLGREVRRSGVDAKRHDETPSGWMGPTSRPRTDPAVKPWQKEIRLPGPGPPLVPPKWYPPRNGPKYSTAAIAIRAISSGVPGRPSAICATRRVADPRNRASRIARHAARSRKGSGDGPRSSAPHTRSSIQVDVSNDMEERAWRSPPLGT